MVLNRTISAAVEVSISRNHTSRENILAIWSFDELYDRWHGPVKNKRLQYQFYIKKLFIIRYRKPPTITIEPAGLSKKYGLIA